MGGWARRAALIGVLMGLAGLGVQGAGAPRAAAASPAAAAASRAGAARSPRVDVLTFSGAIDPVSARLITTALGRAAADGATAFVLRLNTPGGGLESMRTIARAFLNGAIPTIAYVAPTGARAGSAGTFLCYAAQLAAMAPGTEIGAASPVGPGGQTLTGTEATKVTNDAVAMISSWAKRNGRNAVFAAAAVRQAASLPADQALREHVVDAVAADVPALLQALDGRTVHLDAGDRTLHLAGARVVDLPIPWWTQLMLAVANPNLAYWLFTLGFWAIVLEFVHPTLIGGVAGAVAALLGLLGMAMLSASAVGIGLLALGLGLLVADLKAAAHGVLTAGGLVAFVLGSLLLFNPVGLPGLRGPSLSPWSIGLATAMVAAMGLLAAVALAALRRHRPLALGGAALVGRIGVVTQTVRHRGASDGAGQVEVAGSHWRSYLEGGVGEGGVEKDGVGEGGVENGGAGPAELPPGTEVEVIAIGPDLGVEVRRRRDAPPPETSP